MHTDTAGLSQSPACERGAAVTSHTFARARARRVHHAWAPDAGQTQHRVASPRVGGGRRGPPPPPPPGSHLLQGDLRHKRALQLECAVDSLRVGVLVHVRVGRRAPLLEPLPALLSLAPLKDHRIGLRTSARGDACDACVACSGPCASRWRGALPLRQPGAAAKRHPPPAALSAVCVRSRHTSHGARSRAPRGPPSSVPRAGTRVVCLHSNSHARTRTRFTRTLVHTHTLVRTRRQAGRQAGRQHSGGGDQARACGRRRAHRPRSCGRHACQVRA